MTSNNIAGAHHEDAQHRRRFMVRDPEEAPRRARRKRVVVTVTSLALIVTLGAWMAQYVNTQRAIVHGYSQWMMHDLERLVEAQFAFRETHSRFARQGELGTAFVPSQAVEVVIVAADETGWHAYATHSRAKERCTVSVGTGASVLLNMPSARPACAAP